MKTKDFWNKKDFHMFFIELEKAYDQILRKILWMAIKKKEICVAHVQAINDIYEEVKTRMRTQLHSGITTKFLITIGLGQGLILSSYLYLSLKCPYKVYPKVNTIKYAF